ncbi:MAG: hypothetical protein U0871_15050 [Gemmataceae bacterium]
MSAVVKSRERAGNPSPLGNEEMAEKQPREGQPDGSNGQASKSKRGRKPKKPKKPLFFRLDEEDKDWLSGLDQLSGAWTEQFAIERLVKYARSLPEYELEAILGGPNLVKRVGSLLALHSWASHAFLLKHWHWSALCYAQLSSDPGASKEERAFALYRLGFVYLDIAIELRANALRLAGQDRGGANRGDKKGHVEKVWKLHYEKAVDALKKSVAYSTQAREFVRQPLLPYNIGCAYSLMASYTVESNIQYTDLFGKLLAEEVSAAGTLKVWEKSIGPDWRTALRPKGASRIALEDVVDGYGDNAMSFLRESVDRLAPQDPEASSKRAKSQRVPEADPDFVVRFAEQPPDSDLCFVRFDENYQEQYERWKKSVDHTNGWVLRAYERLQSLIEAPKGS